MQNVQLNGPMVEALLNWVAVFGRSVSIEIEHQKREKEMEVKIWAYDYRVMTGKHILSPDELPSRRELQAKVLQDIENRRADLEAALKEVEA